MTLSEDVYSLPFCSTTPSLARAKLTAFLTVHHIPPKQIDNALIVLSELIANAVSHGVPDEDGMMEISWALDKPLLELEVADAGCAPELRPRPFTDDRVSGRGLSIIDELAEDWSVDQSCGTRVRVQLAIG